MKRSCNTNANQTLNYDDAQKAEDWLSSHYPEFVPGFLSFQLSDYDVFSKSMFQNDILITSMGTNGGYSSNKNLCTN
ncbi:hypothetical protein NQ314_014374 [Rhamnusium bicolor]|uniref:Uncharacterized protein n=1 Tax=Rhamnusium bicolor TaxID=1586634 RepID=A0AAV8X2L4_9CUCU|nr:hypothetical protein NQ314_014374 [Rhamnusium bicolor]